MTPDIWGIIGPIIFLETFHDLLYDNPIFSES